MELYLSTMIRQVDSSLLDEWEKMRDPSYRPSETKESRPPGAEAAADDITRDPKAFTAAIRTRIFSFLRGVIIGDYEQAIASIQPAMIETGALASGISDSSSALDPWTSARLRTAVDAFFVEHQQICLDPNARNARHTQVVPAEDGKTLRVQQVLVDPDEYNDWIVEFEVDLIRSRELGEPVLHLRCVGGLASGLSN